MYKSNIFFILLITDFSTLCLITAQKCTQRHPWCYRDFEWISLLHADRQTNLRFFSTAATMTCVMISISSLANHHNEYYFFFVLLGPVILMRTILLLDQIKPVRSAHHHAVIVVWVCLGSGIKEMGYIDFIIEKKTSGFYFVWLKIAVWKIR